jgi:hypothetical protein
LPILFGITVGRMTDSSCAILVKWHGQESLTHYLYYRLVSDQPVLAFPHPALNRGFHYTNLFSSQKYPNVGYLRLESLVRSIVPSEKCRHGNRLSSRFLNVEVNGEKSPSQARKWSGRRGERIKTGSFSWEVGLERQRTVREISLRYTMAWSMAIGLRSGRRVGNITRIIFIYVRECWQKAAGLFESLRIPSYSVSQGEFGRVRKVRKLCSQL